MGFFRQFGYLLLIFIKLKNWKFIFMVTVIPALVSNLYLHNVMDSWVLRMGKKALQIIGAKDFEAESVILTDLVKYNVQISIASDAITRMAGKNFQQNLEDCSSESACQEKYFRLLLGLKRDRMSHYIDYASSADNRAKLKCQLSTGYELYCPFMAYLVGISQRKEVAPKYQYRNVNVFRLLPSSAMAKILKVRDDTPCGSDVNFPTVFPRTLMAQMIFVVISLVFYLLVSTVSCIGELKHSGFLQLMFRKRLSVLGYWLALWTITLIEMAIFAAVLTVGLNFQCSGLYATSVLIRVFLCALAQFCGVASVIFLFTIITGRTVITGIYACVLCIAAVAIIVVNRVLLSSQDSPQWLGYLLLIVPVGNIAEQIFYTLLPALMPANSVISLVLPVSCGLFGIFLIATIYLDFVLKSGNGLRFPCVYVFYGRFWKLAWWDRATLEEPPSSSMSEAVSAEMSPMVCVSKLKKCYGAGCCKKGNCALNGFSALFYRNHITTIVGHNGSGKSTLLDILAGVRHATRGRASVNKILLTDALSRYHIGNDIGYCPQSDALCDRLTVLNTLKLAALSSNLLWNDVEVDVNDMLTTLQLDEKINHSIGSLPSSDKRKVSVIMALIGKPKVLLLDSPSRDMDYISKRRMWKLLHDYKHDHSIIVSTLFMDEAETISDRILFLSGGRIICAGSSFFFKRVFDCRFIIQIASKTECHVPAIIRKITSLFKKIRVRSISRSDLEFEVPITDDHILPAVAHEVEKISGLIDEFGIAHFSLDDVFSKLRALPPSEVQEHIQVGTIGYVADDLDRMKAIQNRRNAPLPNDSCKVESQPSKPRTILAMLRAHFRQMRNSREKLVVRIIVPLVLLLLLIVTAVLEKRMQNEKLSIKYNLSDIGKLDTSKGICFYYTSAIQSIHLDVIPETDCSVLLTGKNQTVTNIKSLDLPIDTFKIANFQQAIFDKYKSSDITKACKPSDKPCSMAFANDWCVDGKTIMENHDVHIGTYLNNENYKPESVALTTIEIFKNIIAYMSRKYYSATRTVIPDFDTEGIQDIRGVFFPFYGLFFQLVLLSVIPAISLNDVVQDKKSGVQKQLISMGMSRTHYWFCTLVTHWIQLAIVYLLSVACLVIVITTGYANAFFLAGVLPPTLIFGLTNSLLCVYILGTLVENNSGICTSVYIFCCLLISMSVMLVQTNNFFGQIMIFLIPQFAVIAPTFYGMRFIYYSIAFFRGTSSETSSLLKYMFILGHTRDSLIALVLHFFLLIALLIVLESRDQLCVMCTKESKIEADQNEYKDCKEAAIVEEINKLEKSPKNEIHLLEVNHLKVVRSSGQTALKSLTFGLPFGEVFGLIGPCGSGKGSALHAIVGDQRPSAGRVDFHVNKRWLSSDTAAQHGFLGHCPKYDPLFQSLTVQENLLFYAEALGIPLECVQQAVRNFQFDSVTDTVVMHATAGVKRRLSLAVAILSNPCFVAIDQASSGVDPAGRQILWQNIKSIRNKQRSVVLAMQDMEEAEALCDRICILNRGHMVALNNINELVHRYKKMYLLELQVAKVPYETVEAALRRKDAMLQTISGRFAGAIAIEQLTLQMQFAIPIKSIGKLSSALKWLLENKTQLSVLFFSFHYATVDQTMKAIIVYHDNELLRQEASVVV